MNKFEGQGLALKQFRKECGFTNQEVVDRVGKSPMWLSDIENGKSNLFSKMPKSYAIYTVILWTSFQN